MNSINFINNYNNKLNCPVFTSLRLHDKEKYQVGKEFEVRLKNQPRPNTAKVVAVEKISPNDITELLARLDTGKPVEECRKILRDCYSKEQIDWSTQKLDCVILEYTKNKVNTQPSFL